MDVISGWHIAKASFTRDKAYLANHMVNNVGSFIFGYIYVSIWRALLGNTPEANQLTTYVLVNQAGLWLMMFIPYGTYLPEKVRSGNIAFEFLKPYSLLYGSFFETLGHLIYNFFFRSIPLYILGILILGAQLPSMETLIPYTISVLFGSLIAFLLNYFIGLYSIKHLSFSGAQACYYFFSSIFGGHFIPAEYYPDFLRNLMPWTPFASTTYISGSIYIGSIPVMESLLKQIMWIAILSFLAMYFTRRITRKVLIQGG